MNLQELKMVINEYKGKFNLNSRTPWQFKNNQLLFKEINNKYPKLFKNTMEIVYLIRNYNNLENLHIFCYCGNKNKFIGNGYHKCCCVSCSVSSKEYQQKHKRTKLNNIDENGLNSYQRAIIKSKQTKLKRYNNEKYVNLEKRKQTNLIKYGVDNPRKNKNIIEKIKQTRLNDIDNNGNNSYQRAKAKESETYLKKYGVDIYFKTQEFKNKFKNEQWKNNWLQKRYETMFEKFNSCNNSEKRIETMKNNIDENGLDGFQRQVIRRQETMKKNNSFNISEGEEEIYQSLLTKFNQEDIFRQYKSKLYPFVCDFYIKSLDLYIEYHGNWTHCPTKHRHPFKNSVEDLEVVEYLKKKSEEINFKGIKKKYYLNVIYVWTNLDVRKLEMFKKNKLNHCIFYNLEQFNNWFNKI